MTIKFQKHYVTDGVTKARVMYSDGQVFVRQADGQRVLRSCITLYAKDYDRALGRIFTEGYVNESDPLTDYFDQGHVRIFPGDALYPAAKARCDEWKAYWAAKQALQDAKYAARHAAFSAICPVPEFPTLRVAA